MVESYSRNTEAHLSIYLCNWYRVVETSPRGCCTHEHRLLTLFLSIETEVRCLNVEVIAWLASCLIVRHVEDNLSVHTRLAVVEHLGVSSVELRSLWCSIITTNDRELAEHEVEVLSVLEVESNESKSLAVEVRTYCECLLNPVVNVSYALCLAEIVSYALVFAALCRENEVEVGCSLVELIANSDNVTLLQSVLCLEEVEILVSCCTEDFECRTSEVSVVPYELSVETLSRNVSCCTSEEFVSEPEVPCRQVVLHTYVVPRRVYLALAIEVEELTVTEVEVSDERFLSEVPAQRRTCCHECSHTVPSRVVCCVLMLVNNRRSDNRVAVAATEVALCTAEVSELLHIVRRTELCTALPEHVV